jgi:hypothetical protein
MTPAKTIRALALALVLAAAVAGCSGAAPSGSPATSVDPAPPETPATTSASATASQAAGSSTAVRELTATSDPLPPGTYSRTGFEPRVTFEIGEGWSVGSSERGFFDVQQQKGTPDVIAVQFGRVDAIVGADGAAIEPASLAEAIDVIKQNPGIATDTESESRLGGQTGVVIEVENAGTAHAPILDVPPGRLGIDPGRRLWIALFDTTAGLLAVMVGGSIADWDHALTVAEPVLESILIDD